MSIDYYVSQSGLQWHFIVLTSAPKSLDKIPFKLGGNVSLVDPYQVSSNGHVSVNSE